MTRSLTAVLLTSLVVLLAGCPSDTTPPAGSSDASESATRDAEDATRDDADADQDDEETTDPNCHYDCFPNYTCEDGEVFYQSGGPIPCDVGGADLCDKGYKVGDCSDRCRDDVFDNTAPGPDGWPIMCEENRPRQVGESCTIDDDCSPGETYYDQSAGQEVEKDLTCDTDKGTCIDPRAPDYLNYCGADPTQLDDEIGYVVPDGQVALPNCADDSYCYVSETTDESCQYCTIECTSNADCPSGTTCESRSGIMQAQSGSLDLCVPELGGSAHDAIECMPTE